MDKLVSELFDLVEKQKTKQDKIDLLRNYNTLVVKAILHMNYEQNVKFNLPEGEPPFKKELDKPIGYQQTTLLLELKRFYIWLQPETNLSNLKKESLFIEMLEGLHYSEAELLCLVKDKILTTKYPSLTLDMIQEAFPDLSFENPLIEETKPKVKKSRAKKSLESLQAS